jgi:hypothetical protein
VYPEFQHIFCGGKFAIYGKVLSPHHTWISAVLDSRYLTLVRWLVHQEDQAIIEALKHSWFGGGKDEHAAEFDRALIYWSVKLIQKMATRGPWTIELGEI